MLSPTLILLILLAVLFAITIYTAVNKICNVIKRRQYSRRNQEQDRRQKELAMAAISELSISKEIQKKFIPLDVDKDGNKLSSGYRDAQYAEFFGYYAGAEGISGDYFDYQELGGGKYYAIIKCDVAGKGIPAALIMIQVATMFLNSFKQWNLSAGEIYIEQAVYQINGFIEMLGFKGRFAAFTLCIFNSETGDMYFCNAGDNIIHIFDSAAQCVKNITLPQTPAAGALSNNDVASNGGYQVQTLKLNRGDILLLYTDGIEEAKRKNGDSAFEEFGSPRVYDIVNAVMNHGAYILRKWHSSEGELHFDFSGCTGGVAEPIMALIAVEKMFRCHYSPRAIEGEWVLIEKKVDAFLKKHFLQYHKYCAKTCECSDNNAFLYYTHLKEDKQYDDLTILGVKRK